MSHYLMKIILNLTLGRDNEKRCSDSHNIGSILIENADHKIGLKLTHIEINILYIHNPETDLVRRYWSRLDRARGQKK